MEIIAEIGSTWHRPWNDEAAKAAALKSVRVAAACGATAVKFQLFRADTLYSKERAPELWERVRPYELPLDYLDGIKIASGDLTNEELIRVAGGQAEQYQIPLAISTGAGNAEEVWQAVKFATRHTAPPILILFHCASVYPAMPEEMNLRAYEVLDPLCDAVGLSDHTLSDTTAMLARAAGYTFFEKHFMLHSTPRECPDAVVSISPTSFSVYVSYMKQSGQILGLPIKEPCANEASERLWARRGEDGLRPTEEALKNE
jgi:sialic acid synthase SpsE